MALLPVSLAAETLEDSLTGIYTNEEQVYFDQQSGKPAPPWIGATVKVIPSGIRMTSIDVFGQPTGQEEDFAIRRDARTGSLIDDKCERVFSQDGETFVSAGTLGKCGGPVISRIDREGLTYTLADGSVTTLRRARTATCWVAVRKREPKPDGSEDWYFVGDVKMHDQGMRARIAGGSTGADEVLIRLRHVVWPQNGRQNLVLYVHTPQSPDRAVSYSWADIGAAMIGINLRFMQASCTIDGAMPPSPVTRENFRG
jgi:hypothetical protein